MSQRTFLQLITPPTAEPVVLAVLKKHLRQDAPVDDLTPAISIASGSHPIAAAYSLLGTAVTVTNKQPVFLLEAGACGAGGSVAAKLQHRDGTAAWADVADGAFTTVTEANDNAIQELAYTGLKSSVRPVATVAGAACEFAVTVLLFDPVAEEDSLLEDNLKTAREFCEESQERSYCEQVWELTMDDWPEDSGDIELERGPWISVDSVIYTGVDGVPITLVEDTDYVVSLHPCRGIIRLAYGMAWPNATLAVIDPIVVVFTTGMTVVPQRVQQAILLIADWLNEHRGDDPHDMDATTMRAVESLLQFDSRRLPFA